MPMIGKVHTAEWRFACSPAEASERIKVALAKLGLELVGDPNALQARSKRSYRKNRWEAEVGFSLNSTEGGTLVSARVKMAGTKHADVLNEIRDAMGLDRIPDNESSDGTLTNSGATRPDIQRARDKMVSTIGSRRELRKLPEHLWPDEMVERMTSGNYGRGIGLIVLTDRRLFFLKDGLMSKTSEDFPLEKVSSVQWSSGLLMGTITIFASGNKAEITNVGKVDGKAMVDLVRHRLSDPNRPAPSAGQQPPVVAAVAASPSADPLEQLGKLGALRDSGILTKEEFDAKKAEILARL